MSSTRRKIAAALRDLCAEIDRLARFDHENQRIFSGTAAIPRSRSLSKRQLVLLTESLFFAAFRAYENFIRDVFLLYCLEKRPRNGKKVSSYLRPRNFNHAEELIQSSMRFLDWNSPDEMIRRAELYLEQGFPIKLPYSVSREMFTNFRRLRNHIAHRSKESLEDYKKVLKQHYTVVPLSIPEPGEFLLEIDRNDPSRYKLQVFFNFLKQIASDLT
jgi:hypothetical protein